MTAFNIKIDDLIENLRKIKASGVELVDIEVKNDEKKYSPSTTRLILSPVRVSHDPKKFNITNHKNISASMDIEIRNPDIDPESNQIFNSFEEE